MKSWSCKVEEKTYIFAVDLTSNHVGWLRSTDQDVVGMHVSIVFNVSCQFISAENVVVICIPNCAIASDHSKRSLLPVHHKVYEQKVTWLVPLKKYHWVIIKLKLSVQHNLTVLIQVKFAECPYCPRMKR